MRMRLDRSLPAALLAAMLPAGGATAGGVMLPGLFPFHSGSVAALPGERLVCTAVNPGLGDVSADIRIASSAGATLANQIGAFIPGGQARSLAWSIPAGSSQREAFCEVRVVNDERVVGSLKRLDGVGRQIDASPLSR